MSGSDVFSGKYISILGDSISTLNGYLPSYCKAFYMQNPRAVCSGISRPMDTWWAQVIARLGGILCVNNSYSGCLVSGLDFPSATHRLRYSQLHCTPGSYYFTLEQAQLHQQLSSSLILPDIIFVYLGTNDWIFRAPMDPHGSTRQYFNYAYPLLLQKLHRNYPNSRIFCATLFQDSHAVPDALHTIEAYNHCIRQAASEQQCSLIELTQGYGVIETIDGIHPSYQGMKTLAERWIQYMK